MRATSHQPRTARGIFAASRRRRARPHRRHARSPHSLARAPRCSGWTDARSFDRASLRECNRCRCHVWIARDRGGGREAGVRARRRRDCPAHETEMEPGGRHGRVRAGARRTITRDLRSNADSNSRVEMTCHICASSSRWHHRMRRCGFSTVTHSPPPAALSFAPLPPPPQPSPPPVQPATIGIFPGGGRTTKRNGVSVQQFVQMSKYTFAAHVDRVATRR